MVARMAESFGDGTLTDEEVRLCDEIDEAACMEAASGSDGCARAVARAVRWWLRAGGEDPQLMARLRRRPESAAARAGLCSAWRNDCGRFCEASVQRRRWRKGIAWS